MRLVIISGRSGSGKTVALNALEDLGFYCIDNLPIAFLPNLEDHLEKPQAQVAVSIDIRNLPPDTTHFKDIITGLRDTNIICEIIYLDADDNTILKRYSETRRKHPLTNAKTTLKDAIREEGELLSPIVSLADLIIETTLLSRQALHSLIHERVASHISNTLQLLLVSFGFKHGLPPDADFVFDLRCLPNPYWQPELRPFTGLDENVIKFLESQEAVGKMLKDIENFVNQWIPCFEADNRSYLTIALGCTGGIHRSVYMAEMLATKLRRKLKNTLIRHRDMPNKSS